jgi:hypothetical protein
MRLSDIIYVPFVLTIFVCALVFLIPLDLVSRYYQNE